MRADMAKVIVERPRRGGDRSRKGRIGDIEFLPTKQGMRRRWTDHKSLNENLAPLRRFLASRVGRRWDAVYAEINEHLAVRNAVQQHVRTHIGGFVALQLEVAPDSTLYDHGWRGANWRNGYDLYVDPCDGILKRCRSDKAYRREAQQRRQERLAQRAKADKIVLGSLRELQRLNGVWYEIEFARVPTIGVSSLQVRDHSEPRCGVYDVIRRAFVTDGELCSKQAPTVDQRAAPVWGAQCARLTRCASRCPSHRATGEHAWGGMTARRRGGRMSYMRGEIYIWADDTFVHFWARDGYDGWDEAGWYDPSLGSSSSGVALPQTIADEYVVMRMAEMLNEGGVNDAIEQTLAKYRGNGGCFALAEHAVVLCELAARVPPKPDADHE